MRLHALAITLAAALLSGCTWVTKLPLIAAFPMPEKQQNLGFAQDFEFAALDGTPVRLSNFAGTPVVLNFWADW